MAFPPLSRLLYDAPTYQHLGADIQEDKQEYSASEQQRRLGLFHELFRREALQLVELLREQGSALVFITAPVNLELSPLRACENADSSAVQSLQAKMHELMKGGHAKEALATLEPLSQTVPGHARTHHLMGQAYLELGDGARARQEFEKAQAFDCGQGRPSVVDNAILRSIAARHSLLVLDFADDLARQLGQNEVFLSDTVPQSFPYQKLTDKIRHVVARQFHLLGRSEGKKP